MWRRIKGETSCRDLSSDGFVRVDGDSRLEFNCRTLNWGAGFGLFTLSY